ncbi:YfjL-like protein [Acetobacterium woodii]|nr:hypothetical protein [Acetobacterium woodii]
MKKTKKIIISAIGIGLIMFVVALVNSFTGNPIANGLAKEAALHYMDSHYRDLNLAIVKSGYNFKDGWYYVSVQSDISKDTAFNIYVDSYGNVKSDDYAYEVENNFTTFRRLDKELREKAIEMIAGKLNYDFDYIALRFVKEANLMMFERDMELDIHKPPLPITIDVVLFNEAVSYDKIAEVGKALEAILAANNVPVADYNIRILPLSDKPQNEDQAVSWVDSLSVSDFPAAQMDAKNLPQVIEQFELNRVNAVNEKDKK